MQELISYFYKGVFKNPYIYWPKPILLIYFILLLD